MAYLEDALASLEKTGGCPLAAFAREELKNLRGENDDLMEYYRNIMKTSSRADEQHCTCVPALRKKVEELLEVIREIEWTHRDLFNVKCPYCLNTRENGHSADCKLAKILKEHKE